MQGTLVTAVLFGERLLRSIQLLHCCHIRYFRKEVLVSRFVLVLVVVLVLEFGANRALE